jgi:hypothetical protein
MSALTRAKLALALMGLVLFGAGARLDDARLRWAGIALVAVAWVLRFVRTGTSTTSPDPVEGEAGQTEGEAGRGKGEAG